MALELTPLRGEDAAAILKTRISPTAISIYRSGAAQRQAVGWHHQCKPQLKPGRRSSSDDTLPEFGIAMYYVLETDILVWRNQELFATLPDDVPGFHPHWFECQPISPPLPVLPVRLNAKAPRPDSYATGDIMPLYSQRLLTCIAQAGVTFEQFPVSLIDRKTEQPIPDHYAFFHLLEQRPALDFEHSIFVRHHVQHLALTRECLKNAWLLFRIQERRNIVLIHQQLKERFERINISGLIYTPIGEYHTMLSQLP
jgi:hypothetical protein